MPDLQAVLRTAQEDAEAGRPPLSHSETRLRFLNTSFIVDYWARNRLNTSFHQQRKALHLVYVKFVEDYLDVIYPPERGGAALMAKDDELIDWQVQQSRLLGMECPRGDYMADAELFRRTVILNVARFMEGVTLMHSQVWSTALTPQALSRP